MTRWNGTPLERFTAKYVAVLSTGCWEWIAGTNGRYPQFNVTRTDGRSPHVYAHRWSYEHHVGPIPDGYEIDHLCHNVLCVNPKHLEAVTSAENKRRQRLIVCRSGHLLAGSNIYMCKGYAQCRECHRLREAKRRSLARPADWRVRSCKDCGSVIDRRERVGTVPSRCDDCCDKHELARRERNARKVAA